MSKNKIKFLICLFLIFWSSVIARRIPHSQFSEADDFERGSDDSQDNEWKEELKQQPKWEMDTKGINLRNPYLNIISGNSKEWSNFEHSRPLKRSDNTLASPVPNSPLIDDLGGLNMSDPISKYHCPINLLYGNNLTVKNFFLLMPRSNASASDTVQSLDSEKQESSTENLIPMPSLTTQNDLGSLIFNTGSETPTQSSVLTDTSTNLVVESDSTSYLVSGTSSPGLSSETADKNTALSGISGNSNEAVTSSVASDSSISVGTNDMSSIETTSSSASQTTCQDNSVIRPTIDLNNEILRTVDKYCETFFAYDTGMSTSISQPANIQAFLVDKSKINQIIPGLKKEKRTLGNKNPRKVFKLNPLTRDLKE